VEQMQEGVMSAEKVPLVKALLVLQNTPRVNLDLPGLQVQALEGDADPAKFDLAVFFREEGEVLQGVAKYRDHCFRKATIQALVQHFEVLLGSIIAHPDVPIKALDILTQEEKKLKDSSEQKRQQSNRSTLKITKGERMDLHFS